MKKQILLPFIAAAAMLFPACSGDNDNSISSTDIPPTSSEEAAPESSDANSGADGTSSSSIKYSYYGAELTGIKQFKYGRFEARMKMAAISGSVSSMFLYYDNSWMGDGEKWNEIDIEVLGNNSKGFQSNIITGTAESRITEEGKHPLEFDVREDYHLYGMIWTPDTVIWEIDSIPVRKVSLGDTKGQIKHLSEGGTQSLRFNLWVSKDPKWTGKFTGEGLPEKQYIDYVRVYSYDTTAKTFTQEWQDDFDGEDLNPEYWQNQNSWDMEGVTYRRENLYVEDGKAVLVLDRDPQ
ncbi:MAG: family 16 glycosylhydrolase [Fibrobacter sp.]|nr:family 16 glycosylhydrolase [Fibrobacter sp.]